MSKARPVIAVPGIAKPPPRAGVYPWRTMEVGESFLARASAATIRVSASVMGRKLGRVFSVRQTPRGPRVWRDK